MSATRLSPGIFKRAESQAFPGGFSAGKFLTDRSKPPRLALQNWEWLDRQGLV